MKKTILIIIIVILQCFTLLGCSGTSSNEALEAKIEELESKIAEQEQQFQESTQNTVDETEAPLTTFEPVEVAKYSILSPGQNAFFSYCDEDTGEATISCTCQYCGQVMETLNIDLSSRSGWNSSNMLEISGAVICFNESCIDGAIIDQGLPLPGGRSLVHSATTKYSITAKRQYVTEYVEVEVSNDINVTQQTQQPSNTEQQQQENTEAPQEGSDGAGLNLLWLWITICILIIIAIIVMARALIKDFRNRRKNTN